MVTWLSRCNIEDLRLDWPDSSLLLKSSPSSLSQAEPSRAKSRRLEIFSSFCSSFPSSSSPVLGVCSESLVRFEYHGDGAQLTSAFYMSLLRFPCLKHVVVPGNAMSDGIFIEFSKHLRLETLQVDRLMVRLVTPRNSLVQVRSDHRQNVHIELMLARLNQAQINPTQLSSAQPMSAQLCLAQAKLLQLCSSLFLSSFPQLASPPFGQCLLFVSCASSLHFMIFVKTTILLETSSMAAPCWRCCSWGRRR